MRAGRPRRPREPAAPRDRRDKLQHIAGLSAVEALFAHDFGRVERLYFDDRAKTLVGGLCTRLAQARKPYRLVTSEELAKIAGSAMHGGVVAAARPRDIPEIALDQARAWAQADQPLLVLDGIGNPHNLGAIARTAAFFGMPRLVLSDHPAQAAPSDAAYRVAEGGLDHLDVLRAPRLPQLLRGLRGSYRVLGTALGRGRPIDQISRDRPLLVVLGNEEQGLGAATLAACEDIATIPGLGPVQSLNVGAAAAILIWEMLRGRPPTGSSAPRG